MQNKKNKKRLAVVTAGLAGVMAIGGIMAYFTDGDTVTNVFTVGKVSLDLIEPNWDPENDDRDGDGLLDAYTIAPEFEIQKDPKIVNDGVNDEYVFMTVTVPYYDVVTAVEAGYVEEDAAGVQVSYKQPLFQFGGAGKPISAAGTVLYAGVDASSQLTDSAYRQLVTDQGTHTYIQDLLSAHASSGIIAAAVNNGWTYMAGTFDLPDSSNTGDYTSDTEYSSNLPGDGIADSTTSETVTDPENGNEATRVDNGGLGTGVSAQTKNNQKFPVIDEVNHQITYLFAYTGRTSDSTYIDGADQTAITLKALKAGEETPTLFDYVKLINITEDQKNVTDLEKTAQSIIINAYGIQTSNVFDNQSVTNGNDKDGSANPVTVWNVLARQSPDTMMAAGVTEEDVNHNGFIDVTVPDRNSDNKGSEVQNYQKVGNIIDGPNVDADKTHPNH